MYLIFVLTKYINYLTNLKSVFFSNDGKEYMNVIFYHNIIVYVFCRFDAKILYQTSNPTNLNKLIDESMTWLSLAPQRPQIRK